MQRTRNTRNNNKIEETNPLNRFYKFSHTSIFIQLSLVRHSHVVVDYFFFLFDSSFLYPTCSRTRCVSVLGSCVCATLLLCNGNSRESVSGVFLSLSLRLSLAAISISRFRACLAVHWPIVYSLSLSLPLCRSSSLALARPKRFLLLQSNREEKCVFVSFLGLLQTGQCAR